MCSEEWYQQWQKKVTDEIKDIEKSIASRAAESKNFQLYTGALFVPAYNIIIDDIRITQPKSVTTFLPYDYNQPLKVDYFPARLPSKRIAEYLMSTFADSLRKYSSRPAVAYFENGIHGAIIDTNGKNIAFNSIHRYDAFIIPVFHVGSILSVCVNYGTEFIFNNDRDKLFVRMLKMLVNNNIMSLSDGKFSFEKDTYNQFIELIKQGLITLEDNTMFINKEELLKRDNVRCGLTPYDEKILTDSSRGHWELWDPDKTEGDIESINIGDEMIYARNPACDINHNSVVAIDFGTKSTVAVILDEESKFRPIRVGTGDYSVTASASNQYENPTVIQFLDFEAFISAYRERDGRPLTKYNDIAVSHNAYNTMNESANSDYKHFVSRIKQYAGEHYGLRKSDNKNSDIIIKPYLELQDGDTDVIEIYAYYLGLYINNMYRKIFIKYSLSMPVNYDEEVRNRIKNSFEKGLKKSFPEALLKNEEEMKSFSITASSNESAAYAVTALTEFGFEPDENEKVFYGIFDFGGGTTDFDFGFWRGANSTERRFDYVITYYDDEGDKTLGGENILDIMAYTVWCDNIKIMKENNIPINIPDDCNVIPDCELLICSNTKSGVRSPSDESSFNNWKLAEMLRWIWENTSEPDIEWDNAEGTINVSRYLELLRNKFVDNCEVNLLNITYYDRDEVASYPIFNKVEDCFDFYYKMEEILQYKKEICYSEIIDAIASMLKVGFDAAAAVANQIDKILLENKPDNDYYYNTATVTTYSLIPDLYDLYGKTQNAMKIKVDVAHLREVITSRIEKGVANFFDCLRKNASRFIKEEGMKDLKVNIFLAGNSCKSKIVEELFNTYISEELKKITDSNDNRQSFTLFSPLGTPQAIKQMEERGVKKNDYEISPDCKTGVAYGLLLTRSGGKIKVIDKRKVKTIFNYYIGYEKKKKFIHLTDKTIDFEKWHEFVDASEDTFEMFYTSYPEAVGDIMPISDTKKIVCKIDMVSDDAMVYYRPVSSNEIEYVVASVPSDGTITESNMMTTPIRVCLE